MKTGFLILIFWPFFGWAQIVESFNDGDFTNNPTWEGDLQHFEINNSEQLHLHWNGADTSVLFTRNEMGEEVEWNFWIKLSFNTSANNYSRIYLIADTTNLNNMNGYFLQTGGADDSLRIMKQTGLSSCKTYTISSYTTGHSVNTLRFKITREQTGDWKVMIDSTGCNNFVTDGFFRDAFFITSGWFGIFCKYTSSNSTKFYFDDFYVGPILIDTIPPELTGGGFISDREIHLSFSEPLNTESAKEASHYFLLFEGHFPDSVSINSDQPSDVYLIFENPFPEGFRDTLEIQGIMDPAGNLMTEERLPLNNYHPKPFDVVINEVLADPYPSVGLPEAEFIELYNKTTFSVSLKGWTLKYGSTVKRFPSVNIGPMEYLVITNDSNYQNTTAVVLLFTSSTSLSNEGTTLVLKDSYDHIIHTVSYSPEWYASSYKSEGGWSLEMIDPGNPCGCEENWSESKNANGGTPGQINSVSKSNPDETSPIPERAYILDTQSLLVCFSEPLDSSSLLRQDCWSVMPAGVNPREVCPLGPEYRNVKLIFNNSFVKGDVYQLLFSCIFADCSGNSMDTTVVIRFAIPEQVKPGDIVINEILPDPHPGGARFAEFLNRSEKIIDLQAMVIASSDTGSDETPAWKLIMDNGYLMFPGDYVVLTPDPANITERYYSPSPMLIQKMEEFPVFNNEEGSVTLARRDDGEIIDKMNYYQEMHYPLLTSTEGVSLERLNPDRSSMDGNNWYSASEAAGFATPGYLNSHRGEVVGSELESFVFPQVFSPDNDGYNDLLTIHCKSSEPGAMVSIQIFNTRGLMIRQIADHVFISEQQDFIWDGMTSHQMKAPLGIYVIAAEIFLTEGRTMRKKLTAAVCGKF
jgi:hypothetical protein